MGQKKQKKITGCRPWHSAKRAFAECQEVALGKDFFKKKTKAFAMCRPGPALGKGGNPN